MMIKQGTFKTEELLRVACPSLDTTLTYLLSHVVRCAGNREKLCLIREALCEIDRFISETTADLSVN